MSEAQVIGVPSEKYGEEVMAWVRVKPGATLVEKDLVSHFTGKIATYKIPRFWKFVDEFPMTVTGSEDGVADAQDLRTGSSCTRTPRCFRRSS